MPRPALLGAAPRVLSTLLVGALLAATAGIGAILAPSHASGSQSPRGLKATSKAQANTMLQRQAACFVPNLGQWKHRARFVHRNGPMTLFLEDRGWVLDLVERPAKPKARPQPGFSDAHEAMPADGEVDRKIRGVALKMTFEGHAQPEVVGGKTLPGHHNYFLGNDESRWRTGVPLYSSVRYEGLYPGIDLSVREANGVPEYDLFLQPGADLSLVIVHVEGAQGLSIAKDGSLVIQTALGPVTQLKPKTWQVHRDGNKREVICNFTLLGADRFGFLAPDWDGDTRLTIDPELIWSTFLGGRGNETARALSVHANGVVTVTGDTLFSRKFPTTSGAYNTTLTGSTDAFVSCLDPSKSGSAQLVYSTFLGGSGFDRAYALSIDASGVVTVAGETWSTNFPTFAAYDTSHNGSNDAFVSRLDPSKSGSAQLVYSTFLGGSGIDRAYALSIDASGVVTVAGETWSTNFPTLAAYDTSHNGSNDAFVSRLDPSKSGSAQLVYSTFLGGSGIDRAHSLCIDASGVVTVVGVIRSQTVNSNFPTTSGAYDTTHNGQNDVFVSRLDPSKGGSAQLVYSTFLGGAFNDNALALSVDASGVVTVAGSTVSVGSPARLPTTSGAYDTTHNGGVDAFVSHLDPSKSGTAQLVYSTFLGGAGDDVARTLSIDPSGVVTVAGYTASANFPTTSDADDTTHNGQTDVFVSRLDPRKTGTTQLVYSTLLGGRFADTALALSVDASGVAMVAGGTFSSNFPATSGAYDTSHNLGGDVFISRLRMGVALYGDVHEISLTTGGAQKLTVNAGTAHKNRLYWIFGSVTGTTPGVTLVSALGPLNIPLNSDVWTDYTIAFANNATLTNTKATLDASGTAQASFNIPKTNLPSAIGMVFYHACLVYDANNNYMASNPVPLKLGK